MTTPDHHTHPSPKTLLLVLLVLAAFLLGFGASFWFFGGQDEPPAVAVQLKPGSPFRLKQTHELLGLEITRIKTGRHPQEFLLVRHVPISLADRMFGKPIDLKWANSIANQYMKIRDADKGGTPRTVEIDRIDTIQLGTLRVNNREIPYWQLLFRFRLGNEAGHRFYEAGILRQVQPDPGESDTLLFAYTQRGSYQRELIPRLLENLQLEAVQP